MSALNDDRVHGPYSNDSFTVDHPHGSAPWLVYKVAEGWRHSLPHDAADRAPFGYFATAEEAVAELLGGRS